MNRKLNIPVYLGFFLSEKNMKIYAIGKDWASNGVNCIEEMDGFETDYTDSGKTVFIRENDGITFKAGVEAYDSRERAEHKVRSKIKSRIETLEKQVLKLKELVKPESLF